MTDEELELMKTQEELLQIMHEQAGQITTLKEALITERFLALDYGLGNPDFRKSMARSQLASEHLEIFSEAEK
jgi:hypothetical protein